MLPLLNGMQGVLLPDSLISHPIDKIESTALTMALKYHTLNCAVY